MNFIWTGLEPAVKISAHAEWNPGLSWPRKRSFARPGQMRMNIKHTPCLVNKMAWGLPRPPDHVPKIALNYQIWYYFQNTFLLKIVANRELLCVFRIKNHSIRFLRYFKGNKIDFVSKSFINIKQPFPFSNIKICLNTNMFRVAFDSVIASFI